MATGTSIQKGRNKMDNGNFIAGCLNAIVISAIIIGVILLMLDWAGVL